MPGNCSTIRERITDLLRNRRTQLPTLPIVAQNIIAVSRDPDTSAKELAAFIEKDQAIANKVLRMANSSYYGMGKKVDTVLRAITIIGFNEIIGLAIGIGILPSLKTNRIGKILDMRQLWLHSLACCFGARVLVREVNENSSSPNKPVGINGENTFLPTLLHDMGKVLFAIYFPDEYALVLEKALQEGKSLSFIEQKLFGFDHAEFAAQLMEYWNFPESIVTPVRFHHTPEKCKDLGFEVRILYLANVLARKVLIGNSYNAQPYEPEKIAAEIGLSVDDLNNCILTLDRQRNEIEHFFELIS
jgi:HD-like signal output (HDOD) protein